MQNRIKQIEKMKPINRRNTTTKLENVDFNELKDFAQLQPFNKKEGGDKARKQSVLLPDSSKLAHPDMYQNRPIPIEEISVSKSSHTPVTSDNDNQSKKEMG